MEGSRPIPLSQIVLVPALITLAITVLRLTGELLDWSPRYFSREAGGGGSLVGISWLVPIFGVWFGVKLARLGAWPRSAWRALGMAVLGLAIVVAAMTALQAVTKSPGVTLVAASAAALLGAWVASLGWPAMGGVLTAYGLAARIPVVVVMLIAMLGRWGTHYDVVPPEYPEIERLDPISKWLLIGLLPQVTMWIFYTVVLGMIFAVPAAALARRRGKSAASQAPAG